MRGLTRGATPASLTTAGVAEFDAARLHFEGTGRTTGFSYKAYSAKDVKTALTAMTGGKCAYCEADYDATQPSDVEHYRPKGAVDTDAGRLKPGYWWLAASWDNLLPSCIRCNRAEGQLLYDGTELKSGKANLFPLLDDAHRASGIGQEAHEVPLLIDPCRVLPGAHVRFVDDGGRSIAEEVDQDSASLSARMARASIDVYGLNRSGLVKDRSRYLAWAKLSLARLVKLAGRLNALPGPTAADRAEIGEDIEKELEFLDGLTCGEDRYTGMLRGLIDPKLAELGLSF